MAEKVRGQGRLLREGQPGWAVLVHLGKVKVGPSGARTPV